MNGSKPGLDTGVFLQADESGRPALRGDLIVKQTHDSGEDQPSGASVGQKILLVHFRFARILARGIDQNLKILTDEGIFFAGEARLQLGPCGA